MAGIDYLLQKPNPPSPSLGLNERNISCRMFSNKKMKRIFLPFLLKFQLWIEKVPTDEIEEEGKKILVEKRKNSMESNPELDTGSGAENFQWSGKRFDTVPTTQRGVQEETSRISINSLSTSLPSLPPLFSPSLSIYIEHLKKTYSYLPQNQSW